MLDFTIEFNSPLENELEYPLFTAAETQLRELAEGHRDVTGAAINIRAQARGEHAFLYEATVVVYSRPEHIAATEKNEDPALALQEALDSAERQIRERRDKMGKPWEQPGQDPVTQEVLEVTAVEGKTPGLTPPVAGEESLAEQAEEDTETEQT